MSKSLSSLKLKKASSLPTSSISTSSSTSASSGMIGSYTSTGSSSMMPLSISSTSAASNINYDSLNEFGFDHLRSIPNIQSFLVPDIISDLLDIYKQDGEMEIVSMIQRYNDAKENEPVNLLFYHKSQKIHEHTKQMEKDLIKNVPEVEESEEYTCSDRSCGSKKIRIVKIQNRGLDEMASSYALCMKCGRKTKVA